MKPLAVLVSLLVALGSVATTAQDVVRSRTDAVRVDVVVSDKRGRPVTNLTAADFEVRQDGVPQAITTFALIRADETGARDAAAPGQPPVPGTPTDPARTIAIVIDDVTVAAPKPGSSEPDDLVLGSLKRSVRSVLESHRGNDVMTLLTLGDGVPATGRFTRDTAPLVTQLQNVSAHPTMFQLLRANLDCPPAPEPCPRIWDEYISEQDGVPTQRLHERSLSTLSGLVGMMRQMPGRKSIVLFSTVLADTTPMRSLIERANAAGIAFYVIDPRSPTFFSAGGPRAFVPPDGRGQQTLARLANDTGGRFWGPSMNAGKRLADALAAQSAYYLLGYALPPEEGSRGAHRLDVRVKRRGLTVHARNLVAR